MHVCVYMHVYVFLHVCECMHVCAIIRALQSVSHKAAAAQAHRLETCTALDALSEWLDGWMNERINGWLDGCERLGIESLPLSETISTPAKLRLFILPRVSEKLQLLPKICVDPIYFSLVE